VCYLKKVLNNLIDDIRYMPLNIASWGAAQWTLYSVAIGLMGGVIGNLFATAATQYRQEQAKITGRPINWQYELIGGAIFIFGIVCLIFIYLIFS
jgi:hypothetical protein